MELPWLSRWQPQLLAILRIVVGLLFLEHELSKFFAFPVPLPGPSAAAAAVAAGADRVRRWDSRHDRPVHSARGVHRRPAKWRSLTWMVHFPKGFWPAANMGEARHPVLLHLSLFRRGRSRSVEHRHREAKNEPIR